MINGINLSNLRNAEFIQFLTDVLTTVDNNKPSVLNVQSQYNALAVAQEAVSSLFATDRGNPITEALMALDERRDTAITGLSLHVQSLTYHFNEAIRAKAKTLADHLALFGSGIAKENYQSQTAIITNIIDDWNNKAPLTDAIASLNLADWKAELLAANEAFNAKYIDRTKDIAAASPENLKAKRLDAAAAYYRLRDFIVSFYTINEGVEPYKTTVNQLNAIVEQYNALLAGRKSNNSTNNPSPVTG